MTESSGETNDVDVARPSTDPETVRRTAIEALPESRADTAELVADALGDDSNTDPVVDLCTEYFVEGLPNGPESFASLSERARRADVDPESVLDAIASVQAALVVGRTATDEASADGESTAVTARELGALSRTVTLDAARLRTRFERASEPGDGSDESDVVSRESLVALAERAEHIDESTDEIDVLAEQQSENMGHLSAEVSDVSAAIEEIAANTSEVSGQSDEARELADEGCDRAQGMQSRMTRIDEGSTRALEEIRDLRDRTDEIDQVVEVINDIADQTNLLALNASIEAARADSGGDGFAVVADEIKSLAEQSKGQAAEIETLLQDIQNGTERTGEELTDLRSETEDGLSEVNTALDTFDRIAKLVTDISASLNEVEDATEMQASSADQLALMIDEASSKADRISTEISTIADANETQREELETLTGRAE